MKEENRIYAVIFDMDGVLIDTEKYFVDCWQKAAHALGYESFGREHALALRSLAAKFARVWTKETFGEDFPYDDVRRKRRDLMKEIWKDQEIKAKQGVRETISYLKRKGYQIAIATASDKERAKEYLNKAGLWDCFEEENIISAVDLENGKPYPDVYLYACKKLGREPKTCIAVEDAPNGVLSAYRAGTKVVMVPDLTKPDEELKKLLFQQLDCLSDLKTIL